MRRRLAALAAAIFAATGPAAALTGDATNDGVFDLRDPLAVCQFLSGTIPALPSPRDADVNFDGAVTDADLDLMMQAIVGAPLPTQALTVAPAALDFGTLPAGSETLLEVTLGNAGAAPITVQSAALGPGSSADFSVASAPATPLILGPGATAVVSVRYAPAAAGADAGTLEILSTGGDATVALAGAAAAGSLVVTPLVLDFGYIAVGDSAALQTTLRNDGTSDVTISSIAPGPSTSAEFTIASAPATPLTLAPGQQRIVVIEYAPIQAGDGTGTIEVLSSVGTVVVALRGRGLAPALDVLPTALSFGNVLVGSATSLSFLVTNVGTAPLDVTALALELGSSADFTLAPLPATPFALAAGDSIAVSVTYAPSGVGPDTGRVEVRTSAGDVLVDLTGAGVAPDIDVAPSSIDFGNVLLGGTPVRTLTILNIGTADLTVSTISLAPGASPALALAGLPALPLVLAPGGSATADVVYAPAAVGSDTATVEIGSDDPVTPSVQVPVAGNGVSPALLVHPNTLTFSNVRAGQALELGVAVTNPGTSDLTINSIALAAGSSADFSLVLPPPTPLTLPAGDTLNLAVRYAPAAAGADSGSLDLDTSAGTAQVLLEGNGTAPEIGLVPPALDFGDVRVGQSAELDLEIANSGSATLGVTGVSLTGSADFALVSPPALPVAIAPGTTFAVRIRYTPGQAGGDVATLAVASDDDDEPAIAAGIAGRGVTPILGAAPPDLDFGDVSIGSGRTLSITLTNAGTAPLQVAAVAAGAGTSADFAVGAPGTTLLAPGASTTVAVVFTPSGPGDASGSVEIATDGGTASIPLSGRGVTGPTIVSVALDVTSANLAEGDCLQVRATATLTNGSFSDVSALATWTTSDASAATVSPAGLVTAVAAGSATVTAAFSGFSGSAAFTVVGAGSLRLSHPCGTLAPGSSFEGELTIDTGTAALGAYAVRILFDPAVVRVTSVTGGLQAEFSAAPGFDPASFGSGLLTLAAYQNDSLGSPTGVVSAARVTFEIVGPAGSAAPVSLEAATLAATDLSAVGWTSAPFLLQVAP